MSEAKIYSDYNLEGLTGEGIKELAQNFIREHGCGVLIMSCNTFQKLEKEFDLFENKIVGGTGRGYRASIKDVDVGVKTSFKITDDIIKMVAADNWISVLRYKYF